MDEQHFAFFTQDKIAHGLTRFLTSHKKNIESLEYTGPGMCPRTIMHDACELGYADVVMIIIKVAQDPSDLFKQMTGYDTPLALALKQKCKNYNKGIQDPDNKHFTTIKAVIEWAEQTGNAHDLLFIGAGDVGGTLVHTIAFNGGADVLKVIIACAEKEGFLQELLNATHKTVYCPETAYEAVERMLADLEYDLGCDGTFRYPEWEKEYLALSAVKAVLKRAFRQIKFQEWERAEYESSYPCIVS